MHVNIAWYKIYVQGVFKWKVRKFYNNLTGWNCNMSLWYDVVRYRRTQLEYLTWLCVCAGACQWRGTKQAVLCVPFNRCGSACKDIVVFSFQNLTIEEQKGVWKKPGAAINLITLRCSAIVEFCYGKVMMSSTHCRII